jgi:hypothetical protein
VKIWLFIAALAACLAGTSAHAQTGLDAPPPLPAETPPSQPAKPDAGSSGPRRTVARLPEADRARGDAAVRPPAPATTATGEPPDEELLPPAHPAATETIIDQKRQGNRVVEIVVTPKGATHSYVIVNREGRQPLTTQELSSGLSTPRFLRFDF